MFLSNLLDNPRAMLIGLLLSLPGILLALCAHESAHAYIADRCGDPTARQPEQPAPRSARRSEGLAGGHRHEPDSVPAQLPSDDGYRADRHS